MQDACASGASVVAADLNLNLARQTVELIQEFGGHGIACAVDVTDPESVKAMVDTAVNETGRLDVLVCSAALDPKFDGTQGKHSNTFEEYPLKQWQDALDVNLTGLFLCAQAA